MKALILAAGKGSRLGEKTATTHKALTELWGEPLFERQLRMLNTVGINDIAVVTGYLNEAFDKYPVTKFVNQEFSDSNMVHSLLCASEFLFSSDEPVIILYGDIAYNTEMLRQLMDTEADLLVPGNSRWLELWQQRMDEPMEDAESFVFDPNTLKLQQLGQPLTAVEQAMAQFMGVLKLSPQGLAQIHELLGASATDAYRHYAMTDFIQYWIDQGLPVSTCLVEGNWIELDTLEDFALYHQNPAEDFISK